MSIIQINNLNFRYDNGLEYIFKDVSFNIDTDWKSGLIGRNGKGKTTFLNLLLGKYEYNGSINKSVECNYFPYEVKDENKITYDIIYEINPLFEEWKIMKELNLLNVNLDVLYRKFCTLSGGEKVKILLASLFLKENGFLLIDEPTNHLDIKAKKEVVDYLKTQKGFILISHDREILDDVVDHIISINNTNIEVQKGNFMSWKENKDRQDNFENMQNEKLKKDITRLENAAQRTSNWSENIEATKYGTKNSGLRPDRGYIGHQSAKMMKKSKVIENRQKNAIQEKSQLLKNIDRTDSLTIKPVKNDKKTLVIADDLSISYGTKTIFDKVKFEVNNGDRIAIIGENGSGKTSILKLIMGEEIEHSGSMTVSNNIKISYISQNTDFLKGTLRNYAKESNIDEGIFKAMLSKLGFSSLEFDKNMEEYSEGQKKKVLIARSITESANIYIWDEPLNFIDILSREQIEEAIIKYEPTMIFIEHDKTFVNNIATKIINL